ncbi:hypothetical protein B9Z55_016128 [Caenorhabditis nigoni]|uniref:SXP/RAL-2 family protein Ani s 5-like cation-binding domain-containing protein n=1 Tax=Caenorhabditis nigoni TaxID=1611254 RepID=A0A2G5UDJ1_9PELO|nr:hypothetical protein B9Z55_016128 [Caenorhabditis nigoni]
MFFYKTLLAVLVSTAVVSAIPLLGSDELDGVIGKTPLKNLGLGDTLNRVLGQLGEIKEAIAPEKLTQGIEIPKVSAIVDGASAMIPKTVSGVVDEVKNTASGVVGTASGVIPGSVSGVVDKALNIASGAAPNIKDGASDEE